MKESKVKVWKRTSENIWVLDGNLGRGFFVIYQYFPMIDRHETTIVRKRSYCSNDKEYFVIKGDFREKFKELYAKGYKACMEFYCSFPIEDPKAEEERLKRKGRYEVLKNETSAPISASS